MKLVTLTSVALLAASTAFAGTLNYDAAAEVPVVEPVATGGGSLGGSGGWIVPLVAIALVALAVSSSDDDDD